MYFVTLCITSQCLTHSYNVKVNTLLLKQICNVGGVGGTTPSKTVQGEGKIEQWTNQGENRLFYSSVKCN